VHGRYYAMDRDKRWERTELSYDAIVDAHGARCETATAAVELCYEDSACSDELMKPHVVRDGAPIQDRDAVVFFNFRPDRARQLTRALMQKDLRWLHAQARPTGPHVRDAHGLPGRYPGGEGRVRACRCRPNGPGRI
jgi:2,3-bisphosphoglycerate-independent phosphoglycerate mutase